MERATELDPSARGHRSPFELQVTHIGYGKTWEKQGVIDAYLMKSSYPNCTVPCGKFKSFTSLYMSWATNLKKKKVFLIDDILCAVPIYQTDEEKCRLRSVNPMEYSRGWAPASSQLERTRVENKITWISYTISDQHYYDQFGCTLWALICVNLLPICVTMCPNDLKILVKFADRHASRVSLPIPWRDALMWWPKLYFLKLYSRAPSLLQPIAPINYRNLKTKWEKVFFFPTGFLFIFWFFILPVHGSLARAGKVKGTTPKVDKQEKKKTPKGRAKKRILYNRRCVFVSLFCVCVILTMIETNSFL